MYRTLEYVRPASLNEICSVTVQETVQEMNVIVYFMNVTSIIIVTVLSKRSINTHGFIPKGD